MQNNTPSPFSEPPQPPQPADKIGRMMVENIDKIAMISSRAGRNDDKIPMVTARVATRGNPNKNGDLMPIAVLAGVVRRYKKSIKGKSTIRIIYEARKLLVQQWLQEWEQKRGIQLSRRQRIKRVRQHLRSQRRTHITKWQYGGLPVDVQNVDMDSNGTLHVQGNVQVPLAVNNLNITFDYTCAVCGKEICRHLHPGLRIEMHERLEKLHTLINEGKDDSAEAEALRTEMDDIWKAMTPEEISWTHKQATRLNIGTGLIDLTKPFHYKIGPTLINTKGLEKIKFV